MHSRALSWKSTTRFRLFRRRGRATVDPSMATPPDSLGALRRRAQADLLHNILPFWARHAFKPDGNLVGIVTHDLREYDDVPRHVVLCARILWTFAAAARVDPRPEWLAVGRKALALLDGPFRDTRHGGFYWSLTRDLQPHSPRKQVYAEAFTIYGLTEWYQATGDAAALARAQEIFALLERHAREPRWGGYIEALDADWGPLADMRLSDKDLNSPKSNNTLLHILEAYTALLRVWPDARVRTALRDLLTVILDRVVSAQPYTHCDLFFDLEWRSLLPKFSYGHDIEASWLFWEAAAAVGDPALQQRTRAVALALADGVLAHGLDRDGAVLYDGDATGPLNTDKHWWPQAEAVVGFLNAHQLGGNPAHLEAALRAWDFVERHVIDPRHGEWFAILDRDGRPYPDYPAYADSQKIGPWKCPYHNGRACIEVLKRVPAAG